MKNILFLGLEKEENYIKKEYGKIKEYEKGEILYSLDSFQKAIGIILSGSAKIYGDGVLRKSIFEGDCFGIAALFSKEKDYVSTIVSTTKTSVLYIMEDDVMKIIKEYPKFAINYIKLLSQKIRVLNQQIDQYSQRGAYLKVLEYLESHQDENGEIVISNMKEFSNVIGIGRASLYRVIDRLIQMNEITKTENGFCMGGKK